MVNDMIELGKGMPDFDRRGNLPPKCWEVTLDDIKEHLVDNFPYSTTRSSRFQCFLRFINELTTNVKSCTRLLINGSFVTKKVNPYDVDFIIVIDSTKLTRTEDNYLNSLISIKNQLRAEYDNYKEMYQNGLIPKERLYGLGLFNYGCDFFRLDKLDNNHPLYQNYLDDKNYWIDWWSHDRYNNPKGFLDLKIDGDDMHEL